jgi:predicted nucleotidyltransferase
MHTRIKNSSMHCQQNRDPRKSSMTRQEILDRLKAEGPSLRLRFGLRALAVFGSMARGDDREGSDLDVLVTFEGKADFDRFMGLKLHLEETFGRSVDLLTPNSLRPEVQAEIEKEAILVP